MIHINEEREDRWVAALCHASMGVMMFGALVPLVVWITQKERSAFLRFQALQALVYQVSGFLFYFILSGCMMAVYFGMFGVTMLTGIMTGNGGTTDPTRGAVFVFLFFVTMGIMLLFTGVMVLGGPAYTLLALWGVWRILRGHDFRYPLLGRLIQTRLEKSPPPAPQPASAN